MRDSDQLAKDALEALRRHWRHERFRPGQFEIIEHVLLQRDVLAILPTGGGKSVCYQVPAILLDGITLVVSPLISLMQDQVSALNARNISATFINSTLPHREIEQRFTDAEFGRYKLVYVAPERLESDLFLARVERLNIALLAVDEAHCISEWGHNFRPSYLNIPDARALMGDPPTIAVTATATPQVRRDVVEHLELRNPQVIVRGFDRPNITWSVFRLDNKREKVAEILERVPGTGILYAATRRRTMEWASRLQAQGVPAAAYHGGMPSEEREHIQEAWINDEIRVICATNAFGMGIDKPDVRFVIHVDVPGNVEAYYQEAGRAGRDGRRSFAVLLFQPADENIQRRLIEDGHPGPDTLQSVYDAVCNTAQIAVADQPEDRVFVDLDLTARLTESYPPKVATAIDMIEREGYWQVLPSSAEMGQVRFSDAPEVVRAYADDNRNRALGNFVLNLMRALPSEAYSSWVDVDLNRLARRLAMPRNRLEKGFLYLAGHGQVQWRPPGTSLQLQFLAPRVSRLTVNRTTLERARRRAERRLDYLIDYANSITCRRQFLLGYFGERAPARCGKCDVCLGRHQPPVVTRADEPVLLQVMEQVSRDLPRKDWDVNGTESERIDALLSWLLNNGFLSVEEPLEGRFSLTEKGRRHLHKT